MNEIDENSDGMISLEEFKHGIKSGAMKKTVLWGLVTEDMQLQKGAKAALSRLKNLKSDSDSAAQSDSDSDTDQTGVNEIRSEERSEALMSASIGGTLLFSLAIFRKLVIKL